MDENQPKQEVILHPTIPGRTIEGKLLPGTYLKEMVKTAPTTYNELTRLKQELLSCVSREDILKVKNRVMQMVENDRPEVHAMGCKLALEYFVGKPATDKSIHKESYSITANITTEDMKARLTQLGVIQPPQD